MTHQGIADMLAKEAEEAERHCDDELTTPGYRRAQPSRQPAQVYSLRIPVGQLEQLRRLAADRHMTPSALMRSWVLERLDAEGGSEVPPGGADQPAAGGSVLPVQVLRLVIREELERAGAGTTQRAKEPRPRRRSAQARNRDRSAEIRAWAKEHGYEVTKHGRIPATIIEEYEAAN